MNESKRMRVGIEVDLPNKPKRSRQDELVQVIKLLAVVILILVVLVAFVIGGLALVGPILRLLPLVF